MPETSAGPVLVTGAFGMLGRRVVAELLARGRDIIGLDLRNETTVGLANRLRTAPSKPGSLEPAWVDLTDADAVRALLLDKQPTTIVHLAAIIPPLAYRHPELARRVNVGGTENLLA